jgi:hypothetical protein
VFWLQLNQPYPNESTQREKNERQHTSLVSYSYGASADVEQRLSRRVWVLQKQTGKSMYNREELDSEYQQHAEYVKLRQQPDLPMH